MKKSNTSYLIVAMLSGMKIGEGILRYCPITAIADKGRDKMNESKGKTDFLPKHY